MLFHILCMLIDTEKKGKKKEQKILSPKTSIIGSLKQCSYNYVCMLSNEIVSNINKQGRSYNL